MCGGFGIIIVFDYGDGFTYGRIFEDCREDFIFLDCC